MRSEELNETFLCVWGWMILCFPYFKVCPVDMLCPFTSKLVATYNTYKEPYNMELILQL